MSGAIPCSTSNCLGSPLCFQIQGGSIYVPDGWYVYDLRGSDYDPDLISTLEARVIVNYAGSILTPEPVIFPDGQDYLDVKDKPIFLMRKSPL